MSLEPLLHANPVIQAHARCAMFALLLGAVQFFRKKGDATHRMLGRTWVVLMAIVAFSGFFIWTIRLVWLFSPIHLLSIFVLVMLWRGVTAARRGDIDRHMKTMRGTSVRAHHHRAPDLHPGPDHVFRGLRAGWRDTGKAGDFCRPLSHRRRWDTGGHALAGFHGWPPVCGNALSRPRPMASGMPRAQWLQPFRSILGTSLRMTAQDRTYQLFAASSILGKTPMMRSIVFAASIVCSVESTR